MTNEQLAALIGEGGNDKLLPLLWEKMRKLYRKMSNKYALRFSEKCAQCGVTAEDIQQECYFAMLDSIKAYNNRKPEQDALLFTSFCDYPFRNRAAALIGVARRGNPSDPLNNYTVPLDEPLTDKDGDADTTRGDLIPDPDAEKPFQEIEREDYSERTREIIRQVLDKYGEPRLWEVVSGCYYQGKTLKQVAAEWGVTIERVRATRERAFRKLRHSAELRRQYVLSEYHHIGVESFTRDGSIVERITEQRAKADDTSEAIGRICKGRAARRGTGLEEDPVLDRLIDEYKNALAELQANAKS